MVIAYEFGNSCFLVPTSEQSIIMVVESKAEFSSMDEFITAALTFLESDSEFVIIGRSNIKHVLICRLPLKM